MKWFPEVRWEFSGCEFCGANNKATSKQVAGERISENNESMLLNDLSMVVLGSPEVASRRQPKVEWCGVAHYTCARDLG
jgi:hypothetical protein